MPQPCYGTVSSNRCIGYYRYEPDDSRSGAEVKSEVDEAVGECQRDKVTCPVRRVAIVEDETGWLGWFQDHFAIKVGQSRLTESQIF